MDKNTTALVMMFKRPLPGQGKQRLATDLGRDAACSLAGCLFDISSALLVQWPGVAVASPASTEDQAWAQEVLPPSVQLLAQQSGNLGQRINQLDQQLRAQGLEQLLFIGSDAPELSQALLAQVGRALAACDIALVPSSDGGVSLMAARVPWPTLQDLPWSTPQLGGALSALCEQQGLSVCQVGHCDDLDTLADLHLLLSRWQQTTLTTEQQALFSTAGQILAANSTVADREH